jgi:hypothetical protein
MHRPLVLSVLLPLLVTLTPLPAGAASPTSAKQYLLITDPMFSGTARTRMAELGITYDTTTFAALATTDPNAIHSNYRAVYVPTVLSVADFPPLRRLVTTGGVLERFVNAGGTLLLNVGGYAGSQIDIAPGGVDYDRNATHNGEVIVTPTHPYFTASGYKGVRLDRTHFGSWLNTDYGILGSLPEKATWLLANSQGPSLVEYQWGRGRVIVSTLSYGWPGFPARTGPAWNNLLLYGATAPAFAGAGGAGPEQIPPRIEIQGVRDNGQPLLGPNGRPAFRVRFTDPAPASGLVELRLEGQNYNVVAVNGRPVAARPLPYGDNFSPGSNITTWEVVIEKIYIQQTGTLAATAVDAAGNHAGVRR